MWLLYQVAMAAILAVAAPVLLLRRRRHYGATLRGRLGLATEAPVEAPVEASAETAITGRGRLWIHAVSVGEVAVAATVARALPDDLPLVVTTVTPTGHARARAAFAGRNTVVAYLPFDLGFAIARFFRRFQPRGLILVEGDYWPLVLRATRRRNLPVAVVNGRVGTRSFGRWRRVQRWVPALFRATGIPAIDHFGVQAGDDADRLHDLGIDPRRVVVTGNLKFESATPPPQTALEAALRALANGRPILIAGSTMQGEDEPIFDAFAHIQDEAMLILVPRHPERWDAAATLAEARGLRCLRRSAMVLDVDASNPATKKATKTAEETLPQVLLLDSMGELAALYAIAHGAFIGGTLVPTGGHNPLEPARFGVPIVVGPSMHNFREMAARFDAAGAWQRVDDATGLAACWRDWLRDPATAHNLGRRAEALLDANRGSLANTRSMLAPLIDRVQRSTREAAS